MTYGKLLREFWQRHDPTRQSPVKQYENLVLYQNDTQKEKTKEFVRQYVNHDSDVLATRIEPLDTFYPAEDYHQNYYLRSSSSLKFFVTDSSYDLTASTLSTKLNAFAGNQLSREELVDQLRYRGVGEEYLDQLICGGSP